LPISAVVAETPLNDGHGVHVVPFKYSPFLHVWPIIIPPPLVQPLKLVPLNVAVPEYPLSVSHEIVCIIAHEHFFMYLPYEFSSAHPICGCFVTIVVPVLETYPVGSEIVPPHVLQIFWHVAVSNLTSVSGVIAVSGAQPYTL